MSWFIPLFKNLNSHSKRKRDRQWNGKALTFQSLSLYLQFSTSNIICRRIKFTIPICFHQRGFFWVREGTSIYYSIDSSGTCQYSTPFPSPVLNFAASEMFCLCSRNSSYSIELNGLIYSHYKILLKRHWAGRCLNSTHVLMCGALVSPLLSSSKMHVPRSPGNLVRALAHAPCELHLGWCLEQAAWNSCTSCLCCTCSVGWLTTAPRHCWCISQHTCLYF